MLIHKKRIKNPKRYLYEIPEGKNFYLAVKVQQDKFEKANYYGLKEDSALRIPIGRGSATHFNADGKWIVKRDLPLEKRVFEHDYHVVDWHGNDHYGTCYQSRMCYQREYIKPAEIAFSYESGIVLSQQLSNFETCYDNIKLAINVMLEIFGECEIWDENKAPIIPQMKEKFVPWEILRSGTRDNAVWEKHIDAILKNKSKSQQNVIRNRHNFINTLKPALLIYIPAVIPAGPPPIIITSYIKKYSFLTLSSPINHICFQICTLVLLNTILNLIAFHMSVFYRWNHALILQHYLFLP